MSHEALLRKVAPAVSRETFERLEAYLAVLRRWNRAINLVGRSTLDDAWNRHILDSAQLQPFLPEEARVLADLGSGAGLPGLVLAILDAAKEVHLIESDTRKAQFLREAARITCCTNVVVHASRVEEMDLQADVVMARALAPLPRLIDLGASLRHEKTICLFLKGRAWQRELTEARESWTMRTMIRSSLVDPEGRVLILQEVRRGNA